MSEHLFIASPGLYLQHCLSRKEVLSRERWLEKGRVLRRGSGARQTCTDVEASRLEYEVLSDPDLPLSKGAMYLRRLWEPGVLGSPGRAQGKGIYL